MFQRNYKKAVPFIIILTVAILSGSLAGKSTFYSFKPIEYDKISRYTEDRVVYQRIEKKFNFRYDNSIETLLLIKDKKMYLMKDGYDNPKEVWLNKTMLEQQRRLIPDNIWPKFINNKPDSIIITDRRQLTLEKYDETFVDKTFGDFYRGVRNKFVKKHADIFINLMTNRSDSGLRVTRKPLPKRIYYKGPTKYFMSVAAKASDDKYYYAEDADGDGITETFMVSIPDGFTWGYNSGPNILFIYNLNIKSESSKEILDIIKNLALQGYSGTEESMKRIKERFPKEDVIERMIDDVYRSKSTNGDTWNPEKY